MAELKRRGKYNAKRVEFDGIRFDSKAEMRRYVVLKDMQEHGEIDNLTVHPKYRLLKGFTNCQGEKLRGVTYTPDFRYTIGDEVIVEDVKGGRATQTALFVVKMKWFQSLYPKLHFRIVEM